METFVQTLSGAGPYISVFVGMGFAISWLMKERARMLTALESATERLLQEREKRALENLETARLLSDSGQNLDQHTKLLEKVLDRWSSSNA